MRPDHAPVEAPSPSHATAPKPETVRCGSMRPRRRTAAHRASRRLPHLIIAGCCALTVAGLSGCIVTGNGGTIGDLANTSVQDALSDAADQLNDASQDIADAFSGVQSDMTDAFNGMADSLANAGATVDELAHVPQALESILGDQALSAKGESLEIIDLKSNATVAGYGNDDGLIDVLDGLTYTTWKLVPNHPDESTATHLFRFTQRETQKAGQSDQDVERVELFTITLYEGSNTIHLDATAAGHIALDLELPDQDMEQLRDLIPH